MLDILHEILAFYLTLDTSGQILYLIPGTQA